MKCRLFVIPVRRFLEDTVILHHCMPEFLHFNEACYISSVFDYVFNDYFPSPAEIFHSSVNMTPYADQDDIELTRSFLEDQFNRISDVLIKEKDKHPYFSNLKYVRADLVKIGWTTKCIYVKLT